METLHWHSIPSHGINGEIMAALAGQELDMDLGKATLASNTGGHIIIERKIIIVF